MDYEQRIATLERARITEAARIRLLEKWIDVVSSPLWKRGLFVIQGYRWRQLGVWYRARWNRDAWDY